MMQHVLRDEHLRTFFIPGENKIDVLIKRLVPAAFFNLFVVACLGLLLRSYPFFSIPLFYKNVLHGHSHFAFGGWVMPVLMALILKIFPELKNEIAYKHWRNIAFLFLISAYGMLLSFPVQGYDVVSIIFSTISVSAGFYLAIVIWKNLRNKPKSASHHFLIWGLVYLCLSAIGPFATGPLIVLGYQGQPVYYNAIYFYLHFQYNGWFLFAVLAVLYRKLERQKISTNGRVVFLLMNFSCVPAFALSLLWDKPSIVFNYVGGIAAFIQIVATVFLVKDYILLQWKTQVNKRLLTIAVAAFVLKAMLQFASAFPIVAQLAFEQRNFVIAYLHLVLLGFVSLFAFGILLKGNVTENNMRTGLLFFFFSFIPTQVLLVASGFGGTFNFVVPFYSELMLFFTAFFPVAILFLWRSISLKNKTYLNFNNISRVEESVVVQ